MLCCCCYLTWNKWAIISGVAESTSQAEDSGVDICALKYTTETE